MTILEEFAVDQPQFQKLLRNKRWLQNTLNAVKTLQEVYTNPELETNKTVRCSLCRTTGIPMDCSKCIWALIHNCSCGIVFEQFQLSHHCQYGRLTLSAIRMNRFNFQPTLEEQTLINKWRKRRLDELNVWEQWLQDHINDVFTYNDG